MFSSLSKFSSGALVALAMSLPGTGFSQTALNPGGSITPTFDGFDFFSTSVLFGSESFASVSPGLFSGSLQWGLWTNDSMNPYGLDKYTFAYRLNTDSGNSTAGLDRVTITGWDNVQTSVGYYAVGGVTPTSVDRSTGAGEVIGVNFDPNIGGAASAFSEEWIIWTDATSWGYNDYNVIDGSVAFGITIAPVPEPEIYAMLAAGLGLMGFVARRRKQHAGAVV